MRQTAIANADGHTANRRGKYSTNPIYATKMNDGSARLHGSNNEDRKKPGLPGFFLS